MKLGIRAKLFIASLGLIAISVVISYAYGRARLEQDLRERMAHDLGLRAKLVAAQASAERAPDDDVQAWDGLADELGARAEARITLIDDGGRVLGDSGVATAEVPALENHRARPEVEQALLHGQGLSYRYSSTSEQELVYVAARFSRDDGRVGVARVAVPLTQLDALNAELRGILSIASLLALGAAIVLSSAAAHLAARGARALTETATRMAAGDLGVRTRAVGNDEFAELGRALDRMAQSLSVTLRQLREERDLLSGILDGMREGVLVIDPGGRIALTNPALREILLLDAEAVGKTLLEAIRHAELKQTFELAARSHEPVSREIVMSGIKPRTLVVRAARVPGKPEEVFGVFVDVTEMRRLETMRRDFVANVSHELRTPVTAIRSAAETLMSAPPEDPEASAQFLPIIERNAERLQMLVEDLLELSRIESRQLRLELQPIELKTAFEHIVSLFALRAARRSTTFQVDAEPGLMVQADRRALEHVLFNLIDNSVKYCPGARVRLSAKRSGVRIELSIEDQGPGIERVHLPRLFERFYRVDAGRSREIGGTGLGLSIVKHLVEAMSGTIAVESVVGAGTTFRVLMPQPSAEEFSSGPRQTAAGAR